MGKTILAVDDEEDILDIIEHHLQKNDYEVVRAETGEKAIQLAGEAEPDLILLDLMLPGIDGFDVCRQLKKAEKTAHIPIIMLSARGEESDIVTGLELGADDYVTKPFNAQILLARLRSVLRRNRESIADGSEDEPDTITYRALTMDLKRHRVFCDEQELNLSTTEYEILKFLAAHPGWVFTRNHIVKAVKGDNYPVTDRSVDVQIVNIRKKLGSHASLIETVRGVGYRFQEQ